jgi:hypothetical protein
VGATVDAAGRGNLAGRIEKFLIRRRRDGVAMAVDLKIWITGAANEPDF